jgi:hypothetical protein
VLRPPTCSEQPTELCTVVMSPHPEMVELWLPHPDFGEGRGAAEALEGTLACPSPTWACPTQITDLHLRSCTPCTLEPRLTPGSLLTQTRLHFIPTDPQGRA